ncbi:FxsA family protein [Campylobacter geochelonis]|uniref:2-isopropylmalate synthase n=1 Tax=Campylobacter geochelonis TaxID=1780362 RepID=A0A128EFZ9_9BACT|nr:FxsA family protein [Campylobacter geochelonis]QKF71448.1 FxsA family membrane protein [Campylobacter geochelonis]CZE47856.1 2-isopropylmalate synthase [Campylobacter geochelonis]CZE48324.1 2-isopropylmalate synthase [Campylobacter geochelonis]
MRNFTLPYIFFEAIFIYLFISKFGFLNFILEVILSGILGVFIIFKLGFSNFTNQIKILTPSSLFGNLGSVFGALLLVLPGIFSDVAGILVLVVSFFINKKLKTKENEYNNTQDYTQNFTQKPRYDNDDIIDVEIIEEEKDNGKINHSN